MRLLLVNGNVTASVTEKLGRMARELLGPGHEVVAVSAGFGAAYIRTRSDYAVAGHAVLDAATSAFETAEEPFDAVVVACFGEPGMAAVRERLPVPVVGMAEASVLTALQLGHRFAIVTAGAHWAAMLAELLRLYAVDGRCAGITTLPDDALALAADPRRGAEAVAPAIERLLDDHLPDTVIVGGAGLAGFATMLQPRFCVPLVDSLAAAVHQAVALARMGPWPACAGRSMREGAGAMTTQATTRDGRG